MKESFQIAGQAAGLAGTALVVFLSISKAIVGKTRDVKQGQIPLPSLTILGVTTSIPLIRQPDYLKR